MTRLEKDTAYKSANRISRMKGRDNRGKSFKSIKKSAEKKKREKCRLSRRYPGREGNGARFLLCYINRTKRYCVVERGERRASRYWSRGGGGAPIGRSRGWGGERARRWLRTGYSGVASPTSEKNRSSLKEDPHFNERSSRFPSRTSAFLAGEHEIIVITQPSSYVGRNLGAEIILAPSGSSVTSSYTPR